MTRKINLVALLIRMGEVLLAKAGLGYHCDRKGGSELDMPQWKWKGGGEYEGPCGGRVYRTWQLGCRNVKEKEGIKDDSKT